MTESDGARGAPIEQAIAAIESRLSALGAALRARDAQAIEEGTQALQRSLAAAIQQIAPALRQPGAVSPALRRRLVLASSQIAAHRDGLLRANAALERAIDVLMPAPDGPAGYAAHGAPLRAGRGAGCIGA